MQANAGIIICGGYPTDRLSMQDSFMMEFKQKGT